jgi:hypothetical protein
MFQSKRVRTFAAMCVTQLPLCLARQVFGATSDWAAVQGLASGARVHVSLTTGKNLNGVIDHVTAEALYLQSQKQTTQVRREEISRLYLKKDKSRIKPVLIGAAAGATAAGIAAPRTMEHESGYGGAVAGTVVLGAAIGAGVGRLASGPGEVADLQVRGASVNPILAQA